MASDEQERRELDRAVAMSQSMTGGPLSIGQESGVIAARKPQFGPATREHYETAKWTMTLPGAHAREILENPDPPHRQREPRGPAFLKPSLEDTRLPALIKILHAIPLAREALLDLDHTIPDYGIDAEWWDGVNIDVRTLQVAYPEEEENQANSHKVIYEIQRLMAFLDQTERAYGSADGLMQLIKATTQCKVDQSLGTILEAWAAATLDADPETPLAEILMSEARRIYSEHAEPEIHPCWCLELSIPEDSDSGPLRCRTLYDVVDFALWGSLQEGRSEYAYLHKLGDVLCVQLTRQSKDQSTGLGIRIPAIWYLDRYLETSREQALDMLAAERALRKEVERIDHATARITNYKSSTGDQEYNALALIEQAKQHFANRGPAIETTNGTSPDLGKDWSERPLIELQRLAENITQKLKSTDPHSLLLPMPLTMRLLALEISRTRALEKFADISQWYTKASEDPKEPPHYKYLLRGVSSSKETIYVLESDDTIDDFATSKANANEWQWWKLSYASGHTEALSRSVSSMSLG